jgi:hypothetical protein
VTLEDYSIVADFGFNPYPCYNQIRGGASTKIANDNNKKDNTKR